MIELNNQLVCGLAIVIRNVDCSVPTDETPNTLPRTVARCDCDGRVTILILNIEYSLDLLRRQILRHLIQDTVHIVASALVFLLALRDACDMVKDCATKPFLHVDSPDKQSSEAFHTALVEVVREND